MNTLYLHIAPDFVLLYLFSIGKYSTIYFMHTICTLFLHNCLWVVFLDNCDVTWEFICTCTLCIHLNSMLFKKYVCNKCLSPLKLWVRIPLRRGVLDTPLCDKVCRWHVTGLWFSPPINWPPQYKWNNVNSGLKHHTPFNGLWHDFY